jgi:squalene cyclase
MNRGESENGAWYRRWDVNYVYGTSNVLRELEYFC